MHSCYFTFLPWDHVRFLPIAIFHPRSRRAVLAHPAKATDAAPNWRQKFGALSAAACRAAAERT